MPKHTAAEKAKNQITKDRAEFNKLIAKPAFKKHRVILPGTRLQTLNTRMRANRAILRRTKKP